MPHASAPLPATLPAPGASSGPGPGAAPSIPCRTDSTSTPLAGSQPADRRGAGLSGTENPQAAPLRPRLLQALDRFERPLIAFARSICHDTETARDAVQDTFVSLARKPPDGDSESLGPWLFTVCRNRLFTLQRKNQRLVPLETLTLPETADPAPGPADAAQARETSSQLRRFIATLPDRQQELLDLKFRAGLSYRDIASATGLTVTNVGTLLHQALENLRRKYAATGLASPPAAASPPPP